MLVFSQTHDTHKVSPCSESFLCAQRKRKLASAALGMTLSIFLSACQSGGSASIPADDDPIAIGAIDPETSTSCEVDVQNQWVYNNMLDYYLFYDQVPNVNPQSYATSEELLAALRFTERDPYSFLTDTGVADLAYEEGREFGLGYQWGVDENNDLRLVAVMHDSPFGQAGLQRGDIIISLNGVPWRDVSSENFRSDVIGTPEAPATSVWQFEKRDTGQIVDVELTASEYQINTVLHSDVYSHPDYSGNIGYVAFDRFLETSGDELQEIFTDLLNRNLTDLILDLRYNRGGRVSIAEYLASLIAGDSRAGQPLYEYRFNDKYSGNNYSLQLNNYNTELDLSRVIVLTRGSTASSSEIVIAGLQPYMEVITMGSTTSGKPYIQRGRNRCGRQLNAIEAEGFNAAGESVFGGIPATCYAVDDRTLDFGINETSGALEGMLETALDYVVNGNCLTAPVLAKRTSNSGQAQGEFINDMPTVSREKQGVLETGGAIW